MPRQRMAARSHPSQSRSRGTLCVGVPDPAESRPEGARRTVRRRSRLHRPARVGRGLPTRCRMARARSDVGTAGRRRTHSARLERAADQRRAGDRLDQGIGDGAFDVRRDDARRARARGPASDVALRARTMDGGDRDRRAGRSRAAADGRAAHARRRTDVRLDRRHGWRRVEHHCAVAGKACVGRRPDASTRRAFRDEPPPALRPGEVVSGRAAAAVGAGHSLANRRSSDVAQGVAPCRSPG